MVLPPNPAHAEFRTGEVGQAYNEAAFRHFLAVDRSRAQRSQRFVFLILIALRQSVGRRARLTDETAAKLFRALLTAVRETDFVGWYHEGFVVAAALAQSGNASADLAPVIANRVLPALRKELPATQSRDLRVRVVRLGNRNRT
jgi:hypothetical protein